MDDYAPRSPDLSALSSYSTEHQQSYSYPPPPARQDSFSLPQSSYYQPPSSSLQPQSTSFSHVLSPSTPQQDRYSHSPVKQEDSLNAWPQKPANPAMTPGSAVTIKGGRKTSAKSQQIIQPEPEPRLPAPGDKEGIVVRTKFPVARIKRIVQADEEVGKVAQVTPPVVGKALELFMIQMTMSAAAEAEARGSKRLTAAHIKAAISKDDKFDFLKDIGDRIPEPTGPKEREKKTKAERPNSDEDAEMDTEWVESKPKRKAPRRKKVADDD